MMVAFLKKQQIAEKFGTSADLAARLLLEKGVSPVDLGPGRGRGLRWYAPAVDAVVRIMHEEAQPKPKTKVKTVRVPEPSSILGKSIDELYQELTSSSKVQ